MSLITNTNIMTSPIAEGDAGIIIRKDGSYQMFNTHERIDPRNMTPIQELQGGILIALSTALNTDGLIKQLLDIHRKNGTKILDDTKFH